MISPARTLAAIILPFLLLCATPLAAQPPTQTGKTFISKEGRFSVQLPSRPKYSTQGVGDDAAINHIYLLEKGDSAYYLSYSDFKPDALKSVSVSKVLDGARDGGVANSKGKLLSEKSITLYGFPGREIAIDLPGAMKTKARERFYMAENRLYTIIFAGPYTTADSAATDAFLASLKLQKPQPVPPSWLLVESAEGRFRIMMPGKPDSSVDPPDKKDAVHLWQLTLEKEEVGYFVAYNDLPDTLTKSEDIESALNKGRDALAKSLKATVAEESLLSVDGNPGRVSRMNVITKDASKAVILFRDFIVKDRYYQIMVIGNKLTIDKAHVDEYMDSFQLISDEAAKK